MIVSFHDFAAGNGWPVASCAAVETVATYWVPPASRVPGWKRSALPYQPKLPLTGASSLARFSENAASAEGLSIEVSKATTNVAFGRTSVASSAGTTAAIRGCVAVVNCQVFGGPRWIPLESCAPVPTFAV